MSLRRWVEASVLGMMAVAVLPMQAQQIQISKENRTIAISTSDEASAVADTAVITIGFEIFGKEQQETYADAARISNAIVTALTQAGMPKEAIESTDQGLHPFGPDNDENKARYAQGMRFQFAQDWRLTVSAGVAPRVLQMAISAGANNSGNIDWQLKQDDALQAEAAAKALAHAREIAASMAKGLGTQLGGLVYASNQTPPRGLFANSGFGNVELRTESAAERVTVKKADPLAIAPQRIMRSATVYAVFAIE